MNEFTEIFMIEMLLLYGISAIGFVACKIGILNQQATMALTQLILYITLPCLILVSLDITFSITIVKEFLWLLLMSFVAMTGAILVAAWIRKRADLPESQTKVYESLMIFGNQGFIGYAVIYILFQEQGIIYLTIFNIYYLILIWTYGIYLFTKKTKTIDWKKILLNPGIVSTLIGLVFLFSPLYIPSRIGSTLDSIGAMTIPLSMIVIGCLIADIDLKRMTRFLRNRYIWISAFVRLLFIPMLLLPFYFGNLVFPLLATAVIVAGMPAASTISLYAHKFGSDSYFASIGVLVTTFLCLFTIPILYMTVNFLYQYTGL